MTFKIKTAEQNPNGLHRRYNITMADGSPIDPNGTYLVLRLDRDGDDKIWTAACRHAARELVARLALITKGEHCQLLEEIEEMVTQLTNERPKMEEQKPIETTWQPKVGDRVTNSELSDKGKVIGVQPPGMEGPTGKDQWRCLVKWDNTALQDSWHDAGDLEFDDAPPLPGNGV